MLIWLSVLGVLVASNPGLVPAAFVGLLIAVPFLAPSLGTGLRLGGLVLALLVVGTMVLLPAPPASLPYIPPTVPVQLTLTARYDPDRQGWSVSERFALSREALLEIDDGAQSWFSGGDPSQPDLSAAQVDARFREVEAELSAQGWRVSGGVVDAPVFEHADHLVSAPVDYFPLRRTRYLPVLDVRIMGEYLSAGDGSTLTIVATPGLVSSTLPPSEAATGPDAEVRTIELRGSGYGSSGVDIETLSPLARFEPVRSLSAVAYENWAGYLLAAGVALLVGAASERLRSAVGRLVRRRQPAASAAPPAAVSTRSTRRPTGRPDRPRTVAGRRRDRAGRTSS